MNDIKLKIGDVYRFFYNEEQRKKEGYPGALQHCFEGLLVAKKSGEEIILVDTFWGINDSGNKTFTLKDATSKGTLTYYCNLEDIEKIKKYELEDYQDVDLFSISTQHACDESCIYYYKRKGAVKSPSKKIEVLNRKISEEKHNIDWSIRKIEKLSSEIRQLEIKGFDK